MPLPPPPPSSAPSPPVATIAAVRSASLSAVIDSTGRIRKRRRPIPSAAAVSADTTNTTISLDHSGDADRARQDYKHPFGPQHHDEGTEVEDPDVAAAAAATASSHRDHLRAEMLDRLRYHRNLMQLRHSALLRQQASLLHTTSDSSAAAPLPQKLGRDTRNPAVSIPADAGAATTASSPDRQARNPGAEWPHAAKNPAAEQLLRQEQQLRTAAALRHLVLVVVRVLYQLSAPYRLFHVHTVAPIAPTTLPPAAIASPSVHHVLHALLLCARIVFAALRAGRPALPAALASPSRLLLAACALSEAQLCDAQTRATTWAALAGPSAPPGQAASAEGTGSGGGGFEPADGGGDAAGGWSAVDVAAAKRAALNLLAFDTAVSLDEYAAWVSRAKAFMQ
ncbi:hypothetical protein HK405_013120 [Cladochytrium tenue]|nr:hypothetical protein HK405_013120 [Cladochytrium tenue]